MQLKIYIFLLPFIFSSSLLFGQVIDSSKVVFSEKVLFDFGKYDLTDKADSIIQIVIEKVHSLPNYNIRITAHTDAIGSTENNLKLSENRAAAVSQLLEDKGISIDNISTNVYGETKPESDNDTDVGRQQNRRATIDVLEKIKFFAFNGQIKEKETNKAIPAKVIIRTKEQKDSIQTDTQGRFKTILPLGSIAGIDVFAKDYFFETQMFKVTSNLKNDLQIPLKKITVGEKVDIKNLFFLGNKAILLKRSVPELSLIHISEPTRPY